MARLIAEFPKCPHCGLPDIAPVSDAPVWVQVGGDASQLIRRGEAAAYLRFLGSHAPNGVVAQHLYLALGQNINVSRVKDRLGRRLGKENIPCEMRPKTGERGRFGVYYLPEHVQVWGAEEEGRQ